MHECDISKLSKRLEDFGCSAGVSGVTCSVADVGFAATTWQITAKERLQHIVAKHSGCATLWASV